MQDVCGTEESFDTPDLDQRPAAGSMQTDATYSEHYLAGERMVCAWLKMAADAQSIYPVDCGAQEPVKRKGVAHAHR